MPSNALKTLRETLKRGSQGGAYYICGEDDFQKEDATKALINSAVDPSVRDFNLDVLRGSDVESRAFESIVSSIPMMADKRVVVVRDTGALRKDARKAVERYLANPSADVVLLLVESSGGKTDKDFANAATVLEFHPLRDDEVPAWISKRAMSDFNTQISLGAAELLYNSTGNDLNLLVTELDKLVSFTGGREITDDDIAAVTGIRRGETITDLLDKIGQRDTTGALALVEHVLSQPKATAVQLVMVLSVQMVAIAWGRAKLEEGTSPGRLQNEYYNLLKQAGSVYLGRSWSSAVNAWASMANTWDRRALEHAMDALLTADVALKETRLSSEEQVVTTLILEMCASDENRIAA
jgi:DNA polymerase-3 subunit delta